MWGLYIHIWDPFCKPSAWLQKHKTGSWLLLKVFSFFLLLSMHAFQIKVFNSNFSSYLIIKEKLFKKWFHAFILNLTLSHPKWFRILTLLLLLSKSFQHTHTYIHTHIMCLLPWPSCRWSNLLGFWTNLFSICPVNISMPQHVSSHTFLAPVYLRHPRVQARIGKHLCGQELWKPPEKVLSHISQAAQSKAVAFPPLEKKGGDQLS